MFKAVFFDLDGTLVDTARDFERTINGLLRADGRPPLPFAAVRAEVSNGARAMTKLAFGLQEGDAGFDERLAQLLDAYADEISDCSTLFDGMADVLDLLDEQDIPWGVVTNKPLRFSAPLMQALALDTRISTLICPDHVKQRKPDPESLFLAADETGVDAKSCLYVGDHQRDIEAGRNAGMTTAAALYGYIGSDDSPRDWQADYYLDSPQDLLNLLTSHST